MKSFFLSLIAIGLFNANSFAQTEVPTDANIRELMARLDDSSRSPEEHLASLQEVNQRLEALENHMESKRNSVGLIEANKIIAPSVKLIQASLLMLKTSSFEGILALQGGPQIIAKLIDTLRSDEHFLGYRRKSESLNTNAAFLEFLIHTNIESPDFLASVEYPDLIESIAATADRVVRGKEYLIEEVEGREDLVAYKKQITAMLDWGATLDNIGSSPLRGMKDWSQLGLVIFAKRIESFVERFVADSSSKNISRSVDFPRGQDVISIARAQRYARTSVISTVTTQVWFGNAYLFNIAESVLKDLGKPLEVLKHLIFSRGEAGFGSNPDLAALRPDFFETIVEQALGEDHEKALFLDAFSKSDVLKSHPNAHTWLQRIVTGLSSAGFTVLGHSTKDIGTYAKLVEENIFPMLADEALQSNHEEFIKTLEALIKENQRFSILTQPAFLEMFNFKIPEGELGKEVRKHFGLESGHVYFRTIRPKGLMESADVRVQRMFEGYRAKQAAVMSCGSFL